MKTNSLIQGSVKFAGLVVALALFASAASQGNAQVKGGERLLDFSGGVGPKVVSGEQRATAMSCTSCKDILVTRAITSSQGLGAQALLARGVPMEQVAQHLCGACTTKWTVEGQGKTKVAVATHGCGSCDSKTVASARN